MSTDRDFDFDTLNGNEHAAACDCPACAPPGSDPAPLPSSAVVQRAHARGVRQAFRKAVRAHHATRPPVDLSREACRDAFAGL